MLKAFPTMKVVTYSSPTHRTMHVRLTKRQASQLRKAGLWPKDHVGIDYCQVYRGLSDGEPTWSNEQIADFIDENRNPQ